MGEYTRGPWSVLFEDGDVISIRPGGFEAKSILRTNGDVDCNRLAPDAFRIVACVNALDGIDDPEAWVWRAATKEQLVPVLLEALRGMIGAYSGHGVRGVAEEQSADDSIVALETAIALVRSSQKALDLRCRREED